MKCLFDTAEEALRAALSGGTTWKAGKSACRTPKITTSTSSSMEAEMEAPPREARLQGLRVPVVIAIEKTI